MFLSLLQFFATKFLALALHLESGSFLLSLRMSKKLSSILISIGKTDDTVLSDGSAEPSVFSYSDCIFLFSLDDAPLME